MTTIPKYRRIDIYKEAIKRIKSGNHGKSGLCNLFRIIAIDKDYNDMFKISYYHLSNYPELRYLLPLCNNGYGYLFNDRGMRDNLEGVTKRLNILETIIKDYENKKIKNQTIS